MTADHVDFVSVWPGGSLLKRAYRRQLDVAPASWGYLLRALGRSRVLRALVVFWAAVGSSRRLRRVCAGADLVVTTYPLAAQALGRLRRRGKLDVPAVAVLTEMAVHPLWIDTGVSAYMALHEVAAEQARAHGATAVEVTGPVVRPAFHPVRTARDQVHARTRFGLPPRATLALVVAGAWGVGEVVAAAADLAATGLVVPVVACGRNTRLAVELTAAGTAIAVGWTDAMAELMRACDVVVQNAGGLSSVEAIACGLPVLTYRCLPGHGAMNAAGLADSTWIPWVRDPSGLVEALTTALTANRTKDPRQGIVGVDPVERLTAMAKQTKESRA
ncbi:MGDG synthase family glycosyltransferase [Labedaea rhizosphaerae]|nr:glycosyltransferase [Labedaea rhizosphaerae]